MNGGTKDCVIYAAGDLLPEAWRTAAGGGVVRTFNPGLLRDGAGWLFAYRMVLPDGLRRIGLCRLDRKLNVIAGSTQALSDAVRFSPGETYPEIVTRWFADPRLYRFGERLFVYWNSGWHEPRNYQFLQELDSRSLEPRGAPRELVLRGPRQKLEKNWTFFTEPAAGRLLALYSITPHRVLEFSLAGEGALAFEEVACVPWTLDGYPPHHGGLRGGAPPCLVDGAFQVFCHSVHDSAEGYRYAAAAYRFNAVAPFAPSARPLEPVPLPNSFGVHRVHPRLNPAVGEVIYPCGVAKNSGGWLVSYGINDEHCAIGFVSNEAVSAVLAPVTANSATPRE